MIDRFIKQIHKIQTLMIVPFWRLYLLQGIREHDWLYLQLSTNTFGVFRRTIFMDDLE